MIDCAKSIYSALIEAKKIEPELDWIDAVELIDSTENLGSGGLTKPNDSCVYSPSRAP